MRTRCRSWYAERGRRPEHPQHPEPVCTAGRTIYFDQQAVEAFWATWQEDVGTAQFGSGRRPGDGQGTRGGGPGREQRERAVAVALDALCRTGRLAAELAREHGGVDRSWQRAVNEARVVYEREQSAEPGTSP
ncbi:hypothetical protein ACFRFU_43590 [Streptomyces sp. NPDC056704]|uniref:hypothetical protein n=1 Tax=Streptomyces sp. NPDC056704 TaxID=3345917 RepID=UPI00369B2610